MHGDTYFSNLPNVFISMVSPLLPVKATPILNKTVKATIIKTPNIKTFGNPVWRFYF